MTTTKKKLTAVQKERERCRLIAEKMTVSMGGWEIGDRATFASFNMGRLAQAISMAITRGDKPKKGDR